jgi:hypothetical protein
MTDGLSTRQVKILTFVVYILITLLTLTTGYQQTQIIAQNGKLDRLPETYVALERYKCDVETLNTKLNRMDDKLDRLIERGGPK